VKSTGFATVDGVTGAIGSFATSVEVTMEAQGGSVLAQPSDLSSDCTSFSVAWGSPQTVSAIALTAGAITPFSPTVRLGNQVQLTANPTGGIPPYSVTWYAAAVQANCTTFGTQVAEGLTYSVSPSANAYYCYEVSDSETPQSSAVSPFDFVSVLVPLGRLSISVSPGIIGEGQFALVSTSVPFSGGESPDACQWLVKSPTSASFSDFGESFTNGCTPSSYLSTSSGELTALGTWAFELEVRDTLGNTSVSPPATVSVSALVGPTVTVVCAPAAVSLGSTTTCEATVEASGPSQPSGRVTWSTGTLGAFKHSSCKLSKDTGACSVKFTPEAAGPYVGILATYSGDSSNAPSSFAYVLNVTAALSKTSVSCTSAKVTGRSEKTIVCTAKVSGHSPTGTVDWSQVGTGSVSLTSPTCELVNASCSVILIVSGPGPVLLEARYVGDVNNAPSSGHRALTVG